LLFPFQRGSSFRNIGSPPFVNYQPYEVLIAVVVGLEMHICRIEVSPLECFHCQEVLATFFMQLYGVSRGVDTASGGSSVDRQIF